MHSLFVLGTLLAALASPTLPVSGHYCGPRADTAAIQSVFLREHRGAHPVARSDIMAIAAYYPGGLGQVQYQGAGVAMEYFVLTQAGWASTGSQPSRAFGKGSRAFFDRMENLRAAGGTECANPAFVAKGSG